jgi:O-antigen/teichoic acid export membrane protein
MDKGIVRNIAINFVGLVVPTFVSLATVPAYISLLGLERYGVIALVWVLIDYFGVLGFAMSVAEQNQVSKAYSQGDDDLCEELFWSAAWINLLAGVLIGLVVFLGGWVFTLYWMDPASPMKHEVQMGLPWLALAVPVTNASCVFAAAMSGAERFGALNAIQTGGTMLFQLVPLCFIGFFGATLENVLAAAISVRLLTAVLLCWQSLRLLGIRGMRRPKIDVAKGLLNFGGWMVVSTVIAMVTESVDRVMVGATFGARLVACYAVPKNLVMRLNIVSISLERSLFPQLSASKREHANSLTQQSLELLNSIFTPIALVAMLAVGPFLHLWVGSEIASVSAPIARVLIIGMWLGGQADITRILIQSQGNPASAARAGVLQLAIYLAMLWVAMGHFGLMGAAVATVAKAMFDYLILLWISRIPPRTTILEMLAHLVFLLANLGMLGSSLSNSLVFTTGAMLVTANLGWSLVRSFTFRSLGRSLLMRLSPRRGV